MTFWQKKKVQQYQNIDMNQAWDKLQTTEKHNILGNQQVYVHANVYCSFVLFTSTAVPEYY